MNHNLVSANRLQGMSAQEAFDHLGTKLDAICARFDQAVAELLRLEVGACDQVRNYIEGIKNCIIANVHWSFRTERYFGSARQEVKRTGHIDVLRRPGYLD